MSLLTQLSKIIVFASLLGALAFEAWHGPYPYLFVLTLVAILGGVVGARFAVQPTTATILLIAYWFPVLFVAVTARPFSPPFFAIWTGALVGLFVADRECLTWSFPRPWRFALIVWTLAVALGWPLVAFRELDFESFALFDRYHVSNSGVGGNPTMVVAWMADVAIVHLAGLLWFDWLFRRFGSSDVEAVERWIAFPLAIGAATGSALALYQGIVDINFLSGNVWPSMARAAGSFLDANAFGMIAAMWSAGVVAVAWKPKRQRLGLAAALVCSGGLWMTGSRTALLAGVVALAPIVWIMLRRIRDLRLGTRELVGIAVATVVIAVILMTGPTTSALNRLRHMPTFAGDAGVDWLIAEFWDRSSYGGAAATMIARHPATGIGIGMFPMLGADHIRVNLHSVPPDNAQNWWRHNIAEMGVLGAAGLIMWTVLFAVFLLRTKGTGERYLPAAAVKGALVAISLASLIGMPAQSLPVTITFWTFAFWYTRLVSPAPATSGGEIRGGMSVAAWAAVGVVVAGYLGTTFAAGRDELRVPMRAKEIGWPYAYGVYDAPVPLANGARSIRTERHGVDVVPVDGPMMVLTIQADHPDLGQRPIRAIVKVNAQTVVDMKVSANVPIVRRIEIGSAPWAVIESWVDRTWQSGDSGRDVGLAISWRFLPDATADHDDDRLVEVPEMTTALAPVKPQFGQ